MIENATVGERLKQCRLAQGLTLKAVEAKAGVSATHISEIERGKTSPTIGALFKIAHALEKDITYFLEEQPLKDVCHLRPEERDEEPLPWGGGSFSRLTLRIPGATLSAHHIKLGVEAVWSPEQCHDGNDVFLVQRGRVGFSVEDQAYELEEGDSIHLRSGCRHRYGNIGDAPAELFHVSGHRLALGTPHESSTDEETGGESGSK